MLGRVSLSNFKSGRPGRDAMGRIPKDLRSSKRHGMKGIRGRIQDITVERSGGCLVRLIKALTDDPAFTSPDSIDGPTRTPLFPSLKRIRLRCLNPTRLPLDCHGGRGLIPALSSIFQKRAAAGHPILQLKFVFCRGVDMTELESSQK